MVWQPFAHTADRRPLLLWYIRQPPSSHFKLAQNEDLIDKNTEAYYPSLTSNRWLALRFQLYLRAVLPSYLDRLEMVGNLILFMAALFAVVEHNNVDPGLVGFALSYALSVTQVGVLCMGQQRSRLLVPQLDGAHVQPA
jgi:hypothetical protein